MNAEMDILGVFIPSFLIYVLLALVLKEIFCRLLLWANAYRFIYHRPLFDVAVYTGILGGLIYVFQRNVS